MKNFLLKSSIICLLVAVFCGCDPTEGGVGDFALSVKSVGADYVELAVTAPSKVEMAYVISEEHQTLSAAVLFLTGKTLTVSPGQVLKIDRGLFDKKDYNLYAAAKLDSKNYSKMVELKFTTKGYDCNDLLTIVDTYSDGFKVHVKIPEETKQRKNAIRYTAGTSLAFYNVLKNSSGDETFLLLSGTVFTGNLFGNYTLKDTTMVMDNSNVIELDSNGEPVLDEYGDQIDIHDPITPGEPLVLWAGECRLGTDAEMGAILHQYTNFKGESYVVPLFDWEKSDPDFDWDKAMETNNYEGSGWTGAFQKLVFYSEKPTKCDETVYIDIPKDEITVTDAKVYFRMEPGVSRYFYMILDDDTYNQVVNIYLDKAGRPEDEINEAFQWFLTSYLAFYEWGIGAQTESISAGVNAADWFVDETLIGDNKYHVLCTVMVDDPNDPYNKTNGSKQRFIHEIFETKTNELDAPELEVTIDKKAPGVNPSYTATYNIKLTNKDKAGVIERAYWACNSAREFELAMNDGATYESLLKGNYQLSQTELDQLNSEEGLTLSFPTLDGEVTRFAIYAANTEYTFNFINPERKGAGWNDYDAPYVEPEAPIESDLFDVLPGDWTLTADIYVNKEVDGSVVSSKIEDYKSKVTISSAVPTLPATLSQDVYNLYAANKYTAAQVDQMYGELKTLTDRFTEYRLEGQNRLLCNGFIDYDFYKVNRMEYKSPYDLFVDEEYSSLDVAQIVYDFGPKWFLQLVENEDGGVEVIVPFNSYTLPPLLSWVGYPFYLGGVGSGSAFYDSTPDYPGFPVEISPDRNTITIKPIVLEEDIDGEGVYALKAGSYYMNALGVNPMSPTSLELISTIKSDIVLTRGWTEPSTSTSSVAAAPMSVRNASATGELPKAAIMKSRTGLKVQPKHEYKADETPNVVTMEMVEKTREKILKQFNVE